MWFNCSRIGMCGTVCVSVSVCALVPCNCSVTLPSFLLFSNPSCMGQHMERASIWAPSPAYLLDTQVGMTHSSPLSTPPASFFVTFFYPPCELSALCVCNMAWSSSWNTSYMWEMLSVLSCIAALCCVSIWSTGLGPFGWVCVSPSIPYIILWLCTMGLSVDLCASHCRFFSDWTGVLSNETSRPRFTFPDVLLLKHSLVADFEEPCQTPWLWCWLMTWGQQGTKGGQLHY